MDTGACQQQLPLYLNRALCNLFFHDWDATEWDCNKVRPRCMRRQV